MTALLIDLGNSRWKVAGSDGADVGTVISGAHGDEAALQAAVVGLSGAGEVFLASVAGSGITDDVIDMITRVTGGPPRQILSTDPMPNLHSGYRRPEQLGVDRLLGMVAARAVTRRPVCVVDAGTAVTIDFVDAAGQHLGGFILPGIRLSRECLLAHTSIPRDDRVNEQSLLGRDTPTAVALGTRYAVAGIVERFVRGSGLLFPGEVVETFIGGGDAADFLGMLPQPCTKLDHLVLRGLAVVAASGVS